MPCTGCGNPPLVLACDGYSIINGTVSLDKIAQRPVGPLQVDPSARPWTPAITAPVILQPLAEILHGLTLLKKACHIRWPIIDRWNHVSKDQCIQQFIQSRPHVAAWFLHANQKQVAEKIPLQPFPHRYHPVRVTAQQSECDGEMAPSRAIEQPPHGSLAA